MQPGRTLFLIIGLTMSYLAVIPTVAAAEETVGPTGDLLVRIAGVQGTDGRVCVDLFASEDGFPSKRQKALARRCAPVSGAQVVVRFKGLTHGDYAAFAFHDADSDGKVKTNWIGMPKEGVGASNQAGGIGGPSFEDARFPLRQEQTTIQFKLKYL